MIRLVHEHDVCALQRRESLASPQRRSSPTRRMSSDAEHVSPARGFVFEGVNSWLEAEALLEEIAEPVQADSAAASQAANGSTALSANPSSSTLAAALVARAAASMAAGRATAQSTQQTAGAAPAAVSESWPGLQMSEVAQASLLAQLRMAQNNLAARGGGPTPASSSGQPVSFEHLTNVLQQVIPAVSAAPGVPVSSAVSHAASIPASTAQPGTSVPCPHTAAPTQNGGSLPKAVPGRPRMYPLPQQRPQQAQQRPIRPSTGAQQGKTSPAEMAAAQSRINAELRPRPSGQQQQYRPPRPQQFRPDAVMAAQIAQLSQHLRPVNQQQMQQMLAAAQASRSAHEKAALPNASTGANHQRPVGMPSSAPGQPGVYTYGPIPQSLPSSGPAGQPATGVAAQFLPPFGQPGPAASGYRPPYFAIPPGSQPAFRPSGSALLPQQPASSTVGLVMGQTIQQQGTGPTKGPGQNLPSIRMNANGQPVHVVIAAPAITLPRVSQQGQQPGGSVGASAERFPQSQPLGPTATQNAAVGQARAAGLTTGQGSAPAHLTWQKRPAGQPSAQDAVAAKRSRPDATQVRGA